MSGALPRAVRGLGVAIGLLAIAGSGACEKPSPAASTLTVRDPWVRAVPPVATMTAAYLRIENSGPPDALVGEESPQAHSVGIHETVTRGDQVSMEPRNRLAIPAGGNLVLAPEGAHLMLHGLEPPPDQIVELLLHFESGASLTVRAPVERR